MKKKKKILLLFLILTFISNTIAYAGLSTNLAITGEAAFTPLDDIRVTDVQLSSADNGATLQYESIYDSDNTTMGFILPNSSSTITYEVTVTNYGDVNYTIYDLITESTNNTNVTYTISGYNLKDPIEFRSSVTFYITFSTNTGSNDIVNYNLFYDYRKLFVVEYDANSGENVPSSQTKYENVDLIITKDIPTKTGYVFVGWTDKKDVTTIKYKSESTYTLDQDILLYAVWTPAEYVINLSSKDATTEWTSSVKIKYNSNIFDPSTITLPQRKYIVSGFETSDERNSTDATISSTSKVTGEYIFNGWYTEENGYKVITNSETPELVANVKGYTDENKNWIKTDETTLYANWTSNSVTLPTITKTGYTCGWTNDSNGTSIVYKSAENYTPEADITMYAVCIPKKITVTFMRNLSQTDTESDVQEFTYGVSDQSFSDKGWSKTGYTLLGWNTDKDATTKLYSVLSGVANSWINTYSPSITLYAIWGINSYTLTINPNGGTWSESTSNQTLEGEFGSTKSIEVPSTNASYTITYNANNTGATLGSSTTKAYRAFTGWTKSGSGSITTTTPLATTTQIYTYADGDGKLTANYATTSNSTKLSTVTKTGYTCTWNTKSDGTGTTYSPGANITISTNTTLYAQCVDDIAPTCSDISISDYDLNYVTVQATCTDEGTGIKLYMYSIDDAYYTTSESNEYNFDSLHVSTIKLMVEDNAENYAEYTLSDEEQNKFYEGIYTILNNKYNDINNSKFLASHPVGSIYVTTSSSESTVAKMQSLYGGTWEVYAQGRTLMGYNSSDSSFNTVGATGGSATTTLTTANLPSHTHTISHTHTTPETTISSSGAHTHTTTAKTITSGFTLTAGSAGAHDHLFVARGNAFGVDTTSCASTLGYSLGLKHTSGSGSWHEHNKNLSTLNSAGAHTHDVTGSIKIPALSVASSGAHTHTLSAMTTDSQSTTTSGATGSGTTFSNLNSYITVYMYRRTS